MDPIQLRQDAAAHLEKAQAIQAAATEEGRELTEAQATEVDGLLEAHDRDLASAEELEKAARRRQRLQLAADATEQRVDPTRRVRDDAPPGPAAEARDHELEARGGFADLGELGIAVMAVDPHMGGRIDERLRPLAAATGMNQAVGPDGGFLVPPQFATGIYDRFVSASDSLLARCDQYTVEGESLTFVRVHETSRANGSRWGGVRGYWKSEAAQMTASKPKLAEMKLEPNELYVFGYVTDKLLRNSPLALGQFLTRAASDELNFLTGNGIINGSGAGQPLGIMNSAALISVAKETSQVADTVLAENIYKMKARMHSRSWPTAVWFINPDVEPELFRLHGTAKNVAGTENVGGWPLYIPPGTFGQEPVGRILGRPVIPIEYCQTVGDLGDIVLADLSAYAVGLRGGVNQAMSMHLRFDYAETAFRFLFELDGEPWVNAALTPFNGTNTTSPFVALAARA